MASWHCRSKGDSIYGPKRTVYSSLFLIKKKGAQPFTAETSNLPFKMTFLMWKITMQDKETIGKRAKEVPESDRAVWRETELVLGHEAEDRGGARVFWSFADIVAVMFWPLTSVHCLMFPSFIEAILFATSKTLRKSVRQNSVQMYTATTFPRAACTFHHRQSPNQTRVHD